MRKLLLAAMLAATSVAVVTPVAAQIAAAIGKPLPSPDLPPGTISVRVVAGSPANPVTGTDVTLVVNGTPRVARSDSAGRAIFKDLPVGGSVQAKVLDEDKKEVTSDEFSVPSDSGARLMLTTKPWNPGGGGGMAGAPFAGGAGMPEPRQMSGEARPEQADAPGSFTVRLTYDDFKDAPPVGVPVSLVGYTADDKVTFETIASDKDGRAAFTGLDRSGATAYFALAQLPRNGAIDRLVAQPVVLDPRVGVRLILSSAKRTSTDPVIDDITRLDKQDPAVPAGKVRVTLEGAAELGGQVTLVDAKTKSVVGKLAPEVAAADPSDIRSGSQFEAKPDVPANTLDVQVHGGAGTDEPLGGISIKLVPAAQDGKGATVESQTAQGGMVRMAVPPNSGQLVAVATINGKVVLSQPFDLAKSGGLLDVQGTWSNQGRPQAVFDLLPAPGQVVYAETTARGQLYRSIPFQPVEGRGTHVSLFIYPRVLFSFSLTSHIDDEFLAVSGRFEVSNNSWSPYRATADGLVIPLPKDFKGAVIAESDQADVAVAQGEGFRIIRPIPPGQKQFHAGFSLPVHHGEVEWALDLPYGAFQSGMEIMQVPGMNVKLPANVTGQTMTVPQGTFFVLPQISILPRQAMVMTISGLPSVASWRVWMPRFVGIGAIALMLGGLALALSRKKPASDATRAERRAKLLDELVELEKAGKADKRREALVAELEQLWDES